MDRSRVILSTLILAVMALGHAVQRDTWARRWLLHSSRDNLPPSPLLHPMTVRDATIAEVAATLSRDSGVSIEIDADLRDDPATYSFVLPKSIPIGEFLPRLGLRFAIAVMNSGLPPAKGASWLGHTTSVPFWSSSGKRIGDFIRTMTAPTCAMTSSPCSQSCVATSAWSAYK